MHISLSLEKMDFVVLWEAGACLAGFRASEELQPGIDLFSQEVCYRCCEIQPINNFHVGSWAATTKFSGLRFAYIWSRRWPGIGLAPGQCLQDSNPAVWSGSYFATREVQAVGEEVDGSSFEIRPDLGLQGEGGCSSHWWASSSAGLIAWLGFRFASVSPGDLLARMGSHLGNLAGCQHSFQ